MNDILSLILGECKPAELPSGMTAQQAKQCFKRGGATRANREHAKAKHAEVLADVGGDREALKTIKLWEPRKRTEAQFFRAFDRKQLSETGNAFIDQQYEVEVTEYDLIEVEVPRARHPDEEVAFARLQRRFRESKPSIEGFFHKPFVKSGDRRTRRVMPAPIGDFNWCDIDAATAEVNAMTRAERLERSLRKIRNVRESLQ